MQKKVIKKISLVFTLVLSTIILAVVIATRLAIPTSAASDTENMTKRYESIVVEPGDSLWSIAQEYAPQYGCSVKTYMKELKTINGIDSDLLQSHSRLIVVYWEEKI